MLNRSTTNSCDMKNVITILTTTCLLVLGLQVHGSNLPDCGSRYRHNCFDTLTLSNGDEYVGEFRDNKANGQRTHIYGPNSEWAGDKYVGEYRDSKKHGRGTYAFADGDKYVGEFHNRTSLGLPKPETSFLYCLF